MRLRLPCLLALVTITLAGLMRGAPAPAGALASTEPIIELPVFEVKDSRLLPPMEAWKYAEIPGFEILSRISERETKRFMRDFLLLQQAIEVIMPGLTHGHVAMPTALILCGRGKGFDEFLPKDLSEERYGTNSLFFKNAERAAIVIDFALAELRFNDNETEESDPYRAFYSEYFRFLIRRQLTQAPPPWFEEGLVQLFASIDFSRKSITFAQIGDGFGAEKLGDFNHILARRAIMPFGEMLDSDGPKARTRYWKAQSYAFVHLCLYGANKKYQRPFLQFVTRLSTEPPSEKVFKECFNKSYKQMALELRGHIEFTVYNAMRFEAKKGQAGLPEPPVVVLREAADAEVGRIKGEVLRLGGHGDNASNTLIAPYVRGERDPRLLAALGLDELDAERKDRARKFLEAAVKARVVRARAHLELARLRLDEARAHPGAPNGQLDAAQVGGVLTPLFTAMKQPPPLAEVYSLLADTWSLSAVAPEAEHFGVVIEGIKRFPRDMALLMQATLLAVKRNFPAEAKALAERGVKISRDNAEQERFRQLAATVAREAAPALPMVEITPENSESNLLKKP